jgi:hypothetical protein
LVKRFKKTKKGSNKKQIQKEEGDKELGSSIKKEMGSHKRALSSAEHPYSTRYRPKPVVKEEEEEDREDDNESKHSVKLPSLFDLLGASGTTP